jgi:DNA-binding phage protein
VTLLGSGAKKRQQHLSPLRLPTGTTINGGNRRTTVSLTRDFKETIRARVERDPKFRKELLREGIESMLAGDIATAKTILRDYINATVGFTELAQATHIPSKSLMRMLGPTGNPRAGNLFEVVSFLQNREGVRFRLKAPPNVR